jgi:hypothetical protein
MRATVEAEEARGNSYRVKVKRSAKEEESRSAHVAGDGD